MLLYALQSSKGFNLFPIKDIYISYSVAIVQVKYVQSPQIWQ